ncbi:PIN domain-containing protein [Alicyclobacillus fodiniaquatilis]|uniref:PIN domain-containing protein n=1 Tax=Alicyclobacillus fodiniaquatilis TaxID=1661150 RepID=A0ABW4JEG2_9BACL
MIAFLDACVLYPSTLRDVLLTLSDGGLYQVRWSSDVLDEMERNLVKSGRADGRVRGIIESAFPDAMVGKDEYSSRIQDMPNHPKDRHVLAAAIACEADILVTANLKDFRELPMNCKTVIQHPDDFLLDQLNDSPHKLLDSLKGMAAYRHFPLDTIPGILNALHKTAPNFVMQAFDILPRYQKGCPV